MYLIYNVKHHRMHSYILNARDLKGNGSSPSTGGVLKERRIKKLASTKKRIYAFKDIYLFTLMAQTLSYHVCVYPFHSYGLLRRQPEARRHEEVS